jgi:hypothetical protein
VNEVVIASASHTESDTKEIRRRRLESIEFQKEMIEEEKQDMQPAVKQLEAPKSDAQSHDSSSQKARTADDDASPRTIEIETNITPFTENALAKGMERSRTTVKLTLDEIEALCDLARGSVLHREKSALAILQATLDLSKKVSDDDQQDSKKPTLPKSSNMLSNAASVFHSIKTPDVGLHMFPQSRIVNPIYVKHLSTFPKEKLMQKEDKSLANLQGVVSTMLDKLKIQIDTTEKALGDKVYLLDSDGDGKISAGEIREAVVRIVNRPSSVSEAEKLISLLDRNKDGTVSLVDLLQYIKKKRESFEKGESSEESKEDLK